MDQDKPVSGGQDLGNQRSRPTGEGSEGEDGRPVVDHCEPRPAASSAETEEAISSRAPEDKGKKAISTSTTPRPLHENLTIAVAEMWRTARNGEELTSLGKAALLAAVNQGANPVGLMDLMARTREQAFERGKTTPGSCHTTQL